MRNVESGMSGCGKGNDNGSGSEECTARGRGKVSDRCGGIVSGSAGYGYGCGYGCGNAGKHSTSALSEWHLCAAVAKLKSLSAALQLCSFRRRSTGGGGGGGDATKRERGGSRAAVAGVQC